jgi:hypothetical protein
VSTARRVGKATGREASGGVPTIVRIRIEMVGTAQVRLCPPYKLPLGVDEPICPALERVDSA